MDQPDTPGNVPPVPNKESDNRSPVVSLIYQTAKSPGTPGVPSGFKVDIETYNTAYTKKWQDVTSFEKVTREQHPDWTNEQVIQARNDHQLDRMHTLEALMAVHKLEWVMEWRVQEELLQIGTEAERTRVKKLDREHRVVRTEGPPSARKARTAKEVVHIPKNPEEKKEAAISVLMNRLGFTREEAEARFTMMEAIKTNVAPTE